MSVADRPEEQPQDILDTAEAGGRAIRGGALFTGSYVLGLLLGLLSVPFLLRHLGKVEFGYYTAASSLVFIIGGFTEAGLTQLGVRELAQLRGSERDALLRHLVGLRLVLSAVGILLAIAIAAGTGAKHEIVVGVAIVGLGLLIQLTQQTYMIPLQVGMRMGLMSVLGVVRNLSLTAAILVLVAVGAPLVAFYWANVFMGVCLLVATLLLVRGTAPLMPAWDRAAWGRILREVLPYALAAAVGLIYFRVAVVLLSYVGTEEETGVLSAAFRIVEVVVALPTLLVTAGFPILARAARDDEGRLAYAVQKIFEVSLIVGVLLGLGLAIGAPFAIEVVAGDGFEESVGVLRIQAIGMVTAFLMVTWTYALLSLKLYRPLLLANGAAALTAVVGTLVLGGPLGPEGAALATVLAEAVLAAGALIGLVRHRPALRPSFAVVPKVAVAAAAGGGLALVVPAPAVVLAVLAGAVYGGIVLALRAVPPEAIDALLRRPPADAEPR